MEPPERIQGVRSGRPLPSRATGHLFVAESELEDPLVLAEAPDELNAHRDPVFVEAGGRLATGGPAKLPPMTTSIQRW